MSPRALYDTGSQSDHRLAGQVRPVTALAGLIVRTARADATAGGAGKPQWCWGAEGMIACCLTALADRQLSPLDLQDGVHRRILMGARRGLRRHGHLRELAWGPDPWEALATTVSAPVESLRWLETVAADPDACPPPARTPLAAWGAFAAAVAAAVAGQRGPA